MVQTKRKRNKKKINEKQASVQHYRVTINLRVPSNVQAFF